MDVLKRANFGEISDMLFLRGDWNSRQIIEIPALSGVPVLEAHAEKIFIDCSVDPYVPSGYTIENRSQRGLLEWNSLKMELLIVGGQASGGEMKGSEILAQLETDRIRLYGANHLDFLLNNPEYILKTCKERLTVFWGTIYHDKNDGSRNVRCLASHNGVWEWGFCCIDSDWSAAFVAAGERLLH